MSMINPASNLISSNILIRSCLSTVAVTSDTINDTHLCSNRPFGPEEIKLLTAGSAHHAGTDKRLVIDSHLGQPPDLRFFHVGQLWLVEDTIHETSVVAAEGGKTHQHGTPCDLIGQQDDKVQGMTSHVSQQDDKVQGMTSHVSQQDDKVQGMTSHVSQQDDKVQGMTSHVGQQDDKVQGMTSHVGQQDDKVQGMTSHVGQQDDKVQGMTPRIEGQILRTVCFEKKKQVDRRVISHWTLFVNAKILQAQLKET